MSEDKVLAELHQAFERLVEEFRKHIVDVPGVGVWIDAGDIRVESDGSVYFEFDESTGIRKNVDRSKGSTSSGTDIIALFKIGGHLHSGTSLDAESLDKSCKRFLEDAAKTYLEILKQRVRGLLKLGLSEDYLASMIRDESIRIVMQS